MVETLRVVAVRNHGMSGNPENMIRLPPVACKKKNSFERIFQIACCYLCALAAYSPRELDVLGLDCNALRVNRTEVCVLKQSDEIRLTGFL